VQLSGWDTVKQSYSVIKRNITQAQEAFANDADAQKYFDKDGDGRVSISELSDAAKTVFRGSADERNKVLMNLRCVFVAVDPHEVMRGITALWATTVAVIATLRSSIAKDVALGVSIGEMMSAQVSKYVKPVLIRRVDDDLKKWVDFGLDSMCRMFGISLALILVRIVSAFHSAIKGGQLIALYVCKFLRNKQLYTDAQNALQSNKNIERTELFMAIQYGLALTGFWWQLKQGFMLNSVLLRFLLLPFMICEFVLTWFAAY
jgi:hypothetical protein